MTIPIQSEPLTRALDEALARSLPAPELPPDFRSRLLSAVARAGNLDHSERLGELAEERARQLTAMHEDFVRLRRRTLVTWIAVAFTTGALLSAAMPTITRAFGPYAALLVLPTLGAAIGITIAVAAWLGRTDFPR